MNPDELAGNPLVEWVKPEDLKTPALPRGQGISLGPFGGSTAVKKVTRTYKDGRITIAFDEGDEQLIGYDSVQARRYEAAVKAEREPAPGPTLRQGADKNEYQYNPETKSWEPAPGIPTAVPPPAKPPTISPSAVDAGDKQYFNPNTGQWEDNPNFDPDLTALKKRQLEASIAASNRGPLGRQLTPAELEYQQLQVQKGKLDIQKAEQDLMSRTALAQQQYYATIQTIQNQLAQGQIEPDEANHLMEQSRAYRDATVQGTTPYQIEKDKQERLMDERKMAETRRNNQVTTAGGLLGNRMQTGGSLASGLLSGASGIYGKILGSTNPPTDFNPLLMSQQFTDEMGGGPEMAQLARSILMGALQQPLQGGQ